MKYHIFEPWSEFAMHSQCSSRSVALSTHALGSFLNVVLQALCLFICAPAPIHEGLEIGEQSHTICDMVREGIVQKKDKNKSQ